MTIKKGDALIGLPPSNRMYSLTKEDSIVLFVKPIDNRDFFGVYLGTITKNNTSRIQKKYIELKSKLLELPDYDENGDFYNFNNFHPDVFRLSYNTENYYKMFEPYTFNQVAASIHTENLPNL